MVRPIDNLITCWCRAIVWHLVQSEQQPGPAVQAGAVGKGKNCRDGFIEVKTLPGTCNLTPFSNFQHLAFTINQINPKKYLFLIGLRTSYFTKFRHQNLKEDCCTVRVIEQSCQILTLIL